MSRRAFLGAGAALVAGACTSKGGGDEGVVAVLATPERNSPNLAIGSTPTPTATPPPPPEVIISSESIYQAGTALVSIVGDVASGSITFLERTFPLTQGTRSIFAFIPADAEDPPGTHPMKIDLVLKNGSKGTLMEELTVLKSGWTVDAVTIPPEQSNLLDPKTGADELTLLQGVYGRVTNGKYWSGAWLLPTPGDITTRFGEQRSYNGSEPSGHHGGTDIGAPQGSPVASTNTGKVVLARQLQLRGNMVIIDHGGGLFSGYAHMASFSVAEGQAVEQGEVIGLVGSTGLSTGAHLHWEMAVGGVLVDALRFTDGTNGF